MSGAAPPGLGLFRVLLIRLGVLVALYTMLRIAFWCYNENIFPDPPLSAFFGGVRFDLSAIAWTNMPWILLFLIQPRPYGIMRWIQLSLFVLGNGVALFFQCIDLGYFAFTMKRTTADFLGFLFAGGDTVNLAPAFLRDYWHIALIYLACLVIIVWVYLKTEDQGSIAPGKAIGWRNILARVSLAGLIFIASRGGLQLIPLQILDAARYGGPSVLPVVLNTPFTMLVTLGKPILLDRVYMPQEQAARLWPVIHESRKEHAVVSPSDPPPNICIIILESFSAVHSARLTGNGGHMPFIDSLMEQSLNFTRAYANGRRSIDGVPAILAAIPEMMNEAFITSPYAGIPFTSVATVLGEGYSTSFYHGGRNGTMGFDGFTRSAGFDRYVGLNEYPFPERDHDGHWGIRDRPFLRFWADGLSREREPFLSCVFTLSSHHPYELPPDEASRFAGGTQKIHATLRYTDDALRQFFAVASSMPWFDRTIFVITSDHTADIDRTGQKSDAALDYWIPLFYYAPGRIAPETRTSVTQQIDILPTLMDLIGYEGHFFSFGQPALSQTSPHMAVIHGNAIYNAFGSDHQIQFDGEEIIGVIPLTPQGEKDPAAAAELEPYLKAMIQQFNGHVREGILTTERIAR